MENKNKIEIPFGAKDSELCECEYTIAEGYEAEIKDGKVIIRKVESEDERIRKDIISYFKTINSIYLDAGEPISRRNVWLAYLEKQGEQKSCDGYAYPKYKVGETLTKKGYSEHTIERVYFCKDPVYICKTDEGESHISFSEQDTWILKQNTDWSEEDSKNMKECVVAISMSEGHTLEEKEQLEDWIKKRLSQKQCNYNPYKTVVESIAKMCKHYDNMDVGSLQDFYDNVKVKCKDAKEYDSLFPQTTWKPSEAQMIVLNDIIINGHLSNANERILKGLQEQLKSLLSWNTKICNQ